MAVIEQTPISNFTGNGVTTVFAFDFLVPLNTDLLVIVDGDTQALGTDYTVAGTGVSSGGTITFTTAPASGAAVSAVRAIPATRSTDYQENGDLLADVLNDDFDRIVLMVQDATAVVGVRAVRGPVGESLVDLPPAASRANTTLGFDSDGQPTVLTPDTGTAADVLTRLADSADTAKGDALIGVKLTESGSADRTSHCVNEEKIRTPADYSATFATAAATWNTNKTAGGLLRIPAGTHTITTGLTFDGQRANIDGDGRQVSIIDFRPAGAAAAITFNTATAGGHNQGRVTRLGFTGGANTQDKTAVSLINTANIEVSDIAISTGAWLGDSIGLYTSGRQSLRFARSEIVCARPIVCDVNATYPTLCTDHFVFDHLELVGTSATRPVIEFLPAVMHTTTTIRNVAIVGGQDGIRWVASGAAGSSYMLHIEDGRAEQAISSSGVGYGIRLEAEAAAVLQTLQIDNFYFGTDPVGPNKERDGLYLRNTRAVTLNGCQFIQGTGRTAIDMTFVSGSRLVMTNCFIDPAATFTLTNARCVKKTTTSGGYVSGEWVYDPGTQAGFANGEQSNDVYNTGTSQTIANGSYITIAGQTYVGFVFISTDEDTGAIFFLNGATGASVEVSDPNAFFTNASGGANQYNVYWDAGSTSYRLQNNRTVGDHAVRVFRVGGVV